MPRNKDNVDLICDIAERAGLFEKSSSLENFLDTVIRIIAWHMKAAVCSIYLYEEDQNEIVLRATQGLKSEAVGNIRLKLGEGLTGLVLKELRPIREARSSQNPNFKRFPYLEEQPYEAFLAVPILRGLNRIGVLVVQDPQPDYFDDNDLKALRAIAAQLATTIESAKLLMDIHDLQLRQGEADAVPVEVEALQLVRGKCACDGIALGKSSVIGRNVEASLEAFENDPAPRTLDDFYQALKETEGQLTELQKELESELSDVASLIFSAHLLILKDAEFSGRIIKTIEQGTPPQKAVAQVVKHYINLFKATSNPNLREKVQDMQDLGHRLLMNLMVHDPSQADYAGRILIAEDLLPSVLLKLATQKAAGLVHIGGNLTSHVSILANSLQIPTVLVDEPRLLEIGEDRAVLLDADQGNVFIDPSDEVLNHYRALLETSPQDREGTPDIREQTVTRDGRRIVLQANINILSELRMVDRMKAEGIGLYRSEFPFIVRNDFPSEEEQYRVYRKIFEHMAGKPVTLRTLDVGGDKFLSYARNLKETNPFLGLRAIRFSLRNRSIFIQQIKAMLRAGEGHRLRIMFPMISSLDDFIAARDVVLESRQQLEQEGIAHHPHPELGIMIELPSAIEMIDDLAPVVRFISIGTNDLVQYVLAVDRTNEFIADLYQPHHPAVLRAMDRIVQAAERHQLEVSVCGDMAADPHMAPVLIGLGIQTLSLNPRSIPGIQPVITDVTFEEVRDKTQQALRMNRVGEIESLLGIPARGEHG